MSQPADEACSDSDLARVIQETRQAAGIEGRVAIAWGHQPTVWHPGVLAKWLAVDAACRARKTCSPLGDESQRDTRAIHESQPADPACIVHLLADHDELPVGAIDYPRFVDGMWVRETWHSLGVTSASAACTQAAAVPMPLPPLGGAPESVIAGLGAIHGALALHCYAESASMQVYLATDHLRASMLPSPDCSSASTAGSMPRHQLLLRGSQLLESHLGAWLLARMVADPRRCAQAFNRALGGGDRRVARALKVSATEFETELPIWRVTEAGARSRATAGEVASALTVAADDPVDAHDPDAPISQGRARLLPTAIIATGIVRLATDGFVHGTGGAKYEAAADRFWVDWLGHAPPPFEVRSADLALAADSVAIGPEPVDPRAIEADPWLFDDSQVTLEGRSRQLKACLDSVSNSQTREGRRRAYEEMRLAITAQLASRADAITQIREVHASWKSRHDSISTLLARDYPFPLHDKQRLHSLARQERARPLLACAATSVNLGQSH